MYKKFIFLLTIIFFLNNVYSQNDSSLQIKSALVKVITFKNKDTVSKYDKEMYRKCQSWELSLNDAYKIFSIVKPVSSEEKGGLYNWLPCYFQTKVLYKECFYTMEINAASFIVLYNKKSTLYFGCSSVECQNFFVLSGGNSSGD